MTKGGKLAYAMGRLGSSTLLSLVDLATFWLYLEHFRLSGLLVGTAFTIGKLVIAFFGWYFGYLSDVTKSKRWGRRKPYIFSGSILLAFSTTMIFAPDFFVPTANEVFLFLYVTFFLSLANLSYGLLSTPYMAWLAEIADPEERVSVSAYQNAFAMLAQVVGVLVSFSLPLLLEGGSSQALWLLACLGAFEVLLYLPAAFTIREKERPIPKPNVRREVAIILGNRNYRSWLALQGLMSMPTAILASLILSYVQNVLTLVGVQYMMVGGLMLLLTIAFFAFWTAASKRLGKKKPLVASVLVLTASLPLTLVIGQPVLGFVPSALQASFFISLVAAGISGWYLFPSPITADIAQQDEMSGGEARAGSYNGLVSIPLNVLQSLARFISGFLADLPAAEGRSYTAGMLLWGPVSSILLLPCLIVLAKYVETDPLVRQQARP
ncbi:MAG: MFS transporter [Candidatus Brockarchaeota archaeon]|nr:MFS transporter [Candidatus Brockarchaeota archaeon]